MNMNGPIRISGVVMLIDDSNEDRVIEADYGFPMGTYPSSADIEDAIKTVMAQVTDSVEGAWRLFTKREMFDYMVAEKTGSDTRFAMPGSDEWDNPRA